MNEIEELYAQRGFLPYLKHASSLQFWLRQTANNSYWWGQDFEDVSPFDVPLIGLQTLEDDVFNRLHLYFNGSGLRVIYPEKDARVDTGITPTEQERKSFAQIQSLPTKGNRRLRECVRLANAFLILTLTERFVAQRNSALPLEFSLEKIPAPVLEGRFVKTKTLPWNLQDYENGIWRVSGYFPMVWDHTSPRGDTGAAVRSAT